jgi:hypothetical protein
LDFCCCFVYVAAPLVCSSLAGLSHYYPTGLTAPWRVQLTVAPNSEIVSVAANITSATIIQAEICFQVINLGAAVDAMVVLSTFAGSSILSFSRFRPRLPRCTKTTCGWFFYVLEIFAAESAMNGFNR